MKCSPRTLDGAGSGGRKNSIGTGGEFGWGPPPLPRPVPPPPPRPAPAPPPPRRPCPTRPLLNSFDHRTGQKERDDEKEDDDCVHEERHHDAGAPGLVARRETDRRSITRALFQRVVGRASDVLEVCHAALS